MTKIQNKTKNNDGFSFADYTSFAQVLNVDVSVVCFMLAEVSLQGFKLSRLSWHEVKNDPRPAVGVILFSRYPSKSLSKIKAGSKCPPSGLVYWALTDFCQTSCDNPVWGCIEKPKDYFNKMHFYYLYNLYKYIFPCMMRLNIISDLHNSSSDLSLF